MGEFYEACRGLGEAARALKLPFMSGNVSFYNESKYSSVPPTPEITGLGLVEDIRNCVTSDFKKEHNHVYLIGSKTKKELAGSAYYQILDVDGGQVPQADFSLLKKCMDAILESMQQGYIAACHDCSEGGMAVTLAEMCIGGRLGCNCNISHDKGSLRSDLFLFSETNTRWIVEVKKGKRNEFETLMNNAKIPCFFLGIVKGDHLRVTENNEDIINQSVPDLDEWWRHSISEVMGG
jgi:phosphoribosylformylglycinamidine synthase